MTVRTDQASVVGFAYVDGMAGPSVKGAPIRGTATLKDARRAVESPVVTVRMGSIPFEVLTDKEIASLFLPPRPPWFVQGFDDGTYDLFRNPVGPSHPRSLPILKVTRKDVAPLQGIPIDSVPEPGSAGEPAFAGRVLRLLGRNRDTRSENRTSHRRSQPTSNDALAEISERGRFIAQLDRIAEWATDAVNAIGADARSLGCYIAYRQDDRWFVAFGRMAEDGTSFRTACEAMGSGPYGWPFDVAVYDPLREDRGWLRSAGSAIAVSMKQSAFSSAVEAYNYLVVPESDGSNSVYWYPGTWIPGVTFLGADFRVAVTADEEVTVEPYHKALLKSEAGAPILAHTHMHAQDPVPLDVSYVLMGRPPFPSLILCKDWSYFVARDGTLAVLDLDGDAEIDEELLEMIETFVRRAIEAGI